MASCQRFTLFGACQQRGINVDTHGQEGEELSEKDYHRLADLTLGEIMVKLEALIEDTPGIADSDLEYSQVSTKDHETLLVHVRTILGLKGYHVFAKQH